MDSDSLLITYRLSFAGREGIAFRIELDGRTAKLVVNEGDTPPDWARLDFKRCQNCRLDASRHSYCPAAAAVAGVIEKCRDLSSHTEVSVSVETAERTTSARTTMQVALRSVVGLYLAASGCPATAKLRPMARFHLPLASEEETLWRSVCNYLVAQYFLERRGGSAGLDLSGLGAIYEQLHEVNAGLKKRLQAVTQRGANINAMILLDLFAQEFPFSIEENLAEFEGLYAPFFTP